MDVERIRGLSKGALRIGFLLVNLGTKASVMPTKEIMRLTGIADTSTFYKAKRELIDAGFLTKPMDGTFALPRFVSSAEGTQRSGVTDRLIDSNDCAGSIYQSIYLSSTRMPQPVEPAHEEGMGNIPLVGGNSSPIERELYPYSGNYTPTSGNSSPTVGNIPLPLSLYERCQQVDAMDSTGDSNQITSPFGIRRKAQYPLMKEIWQQFFPGQYIPGDSNLRLFLQLSDNNVSTFHDVVEMAVTGAKNPIGAPVAFIRKVLENRKNEPAPRPTAPRPAAKPFSSSAKPSGQNPVTNGDAITADELSPDSPEFQKEREEFRRKYGNLFAEDDE